MQITEPLSQPRSRSFDALAYVRHMEAVGFTREQAVALAEEQGKLIDDRLATKDDMEALRLSTKADIEALRLSTKADIAASESKLTIAIEKSKSETIRWMITSIVALGAFLYGVARMHG